MNKVTVELAIGASKGHWWAETVQINVEPDTPTSEYGQLAFDALPSGIHRRNDIVFFTVLGHEVVGAEES